MRKPAHVMVTLRNPAARSGEQDNPGSMRGQWPSFNGSFSFTNTAAVGLCGQQTAASANAEDGQFDVQDMALPIKQVNPARV